GRCPTSDIPGYILSQLAGAAVAATLALYLKGEPVNTPEDIRIGPALLAEFIGTFALVYVVLNVATAHATAGNSNYGLAIGFTVMAMAYAFGGISGGVFNPAVALGVTMMRLANAANLWVYLVANFTAAAVAAAVFRWINPEDPKAT